MIFFFRDLKHSLRALVRRPVFGIVTVTTLAIGIGANSAVFSVLDGVILKPLPYDSPEELVTVTNRIEASGQSRVAVSGPDFVAYRSRASVFESLEATFSISTSITGEEGAEGVVLSWVTPELLDMLGMTPAVGRGFSVDDIVTLDPALFGDTAVVPPPLRAMISASLWQSRFGGSLSVLGRVVEINGQNMEIIGVVPRGFRLMLEPGAPMPTDIDVWTLWPFELADMTPGPAGFVTVLGRLGDGRTLEDAQSQMDQIAASLSAERPGYAGIDFGINVTSLHTDVTGDVSQPLLVLFGAVALVLLIACANVANLFLVRSRSREREIAVRTALGGSRRRILSQLLADATVVAVLGALGGVLLAWGTLDLFLAIGVQGVPRLDSVQLDMRALGVTLAAGAVAAAVAATVPYLHLNGLSPASVLIDRSGGESKRGTLLRNGLVVGEIALSVALLVGAGLLFRTLRAYADTDPGFDAGQVSAFRVSLPVFSYRGGEVQAGFFRDLKRRVEALPGVSSVGGVNQLPLAGATRSTSGTYRSVTGSTQGSDARGAEYRVVLPGYFETMSIPVTTGGAFGDVDNVLEERTQLVVIDEKLARSEWPGEDPIGRLLVVERGGGLGEVEEEQVRVIGVVGSVRGKNLASIDDPTIYFVHADRSSDIMDLVVKSEPGVAGLGGAVRDAVAILDPDVPILEVSSMDAYVREATATSRFSMILLGSFAIVAVVLALIGLYGVVSNMTRLRYREFGVRIALGASRGRVVAMVVRSGLLLSMIGSVVGVVGAALLSRLLDGLLYGVAGTDLPTYLAIIGLLTLTAAVASVVPALRAARLDLVTVLKAD